MQQEANRGEFIIPDDISIIEGNQDQKQELIGPEFHSRNHTFGGLHINYTLYFFIPLLIFACCFSYYQAVSKKEEKPFPHATITNTACHYPQDIVFRYLMLSAGGFLNLAYYCVFRWLNKEKQRIGYPGGIYGWLLPLGQVSTLGFLAAIGTIDGDGYPIIHDIGAVFFFIVLFLISIIVTVVARDMKSWDATFITRSSYLSKTLVAIYLLGMVGFCVVDALLNLKNEENDDDPVVVILEWNLVFVCLIWLMTFKFDWTHIFITMKGDPAATVKRIEPQ